MKTEIDLKIDQNVPRHQAYKKKKIRKSKQKAKLWHNIELHVPLHTHSPESVHDAIRRGHYGHIQKIKRSNKQEFK